MLFIFDENYPVEFVKGIAILEAADRKTKIKTNIIHSTDFMGKSGEDDTDIIKKASKKNAIIITHDSDFKRIKHYKPILIEHKVGYIYFRVPKGQYRYWDIVKSFINKWQELKENISTSEHPFAFEIGKNGNLCRLPF